MTLQLLSVREHRNGTPGHPLEFRGTHIAPRGACGCMHHDAYSSNVSTDERCLLGAGVKLQHQPRTQSINLGCYQHRN
jgi:hypothetical protein